MTDGPSSIRPEPESLHDVLSTDELKELLSPLPIHPETGAPRSSILVVSEHPSDVESLTEYLKPRHISVVPARDRFAALDVFRQRHFLGVIADIDSVGADVGGYVSRLEQVRPEIVVRFLCAPGESASPRAQRLEAFGKVVERPLDTSKMALLCAFLPEGIQAPEDVIRGNGAVVANTPDPLVAVRALLEAQINGAGTLADGLRRWLELDPAVSGLVTAEREEEEWVLRGRASDDDSRRRMMESGVGLFSASQERELQAADAFLVFRDPTRIETAIGVWRGAGATADAHARDLCERLLPLLPLIASAGASPAGRLGASSETTTSTAAADMRETLISVLEARMHSCERRDGRLGLMVAERQSSDGGVTRGLRLQSDLKEMLRGSDWTVVDRGRVYAVLDEPDQGWQSAVESRLRDLAGFEEMRLVGVAWSPSGGNARALVESAERTLSEQTTTPTVQFLDM